MLIVGFSCISILCRLSTLADSMGEWCNKAHYDVNGQEVISACLTQGKYDIHHFHVKPSFHLGSGNLDPNVSLHPKKLAVTLHHYSLPLRSVVKQCYSPSGQTSDPFVKSTLWLTGDLRVCSLSSWEPTSLPTRYPPIFFLPSLPIRKFTHTKYDLFTIWCVF